MNSLKSSLETLASLSGQLVRLIFSTAVGQPTLSSRYPQTTLTLDSVLRADIARAHRQWVCRHAGRRDRRAGSDRQYDEAGASAVEHANACLSKVHACEVFQYWCCRRCAGVTTRQCLANSGSDHSIPRNCLLGASGRKQLPARCQCTGGTNCPRTRQVFDSAAGLGRPPRRGMARGAGSSQSVTAGRTGLFITRQFSIIIFVRSLCYCAIGLAYWRLEASFMSKSSRCSTLCSLKD